MEFAGALTLILLKFVGDTLAEALSNDTLSKETDRSETIEDKSVGKSSANTLGGGITGNRADGLVMYLWDRLQQDNSPLTEQLSRAVWLSYKQALAAIAANKRFELIGQDVRMYRGRPIYPEASRSAIRWYDQHLEQLKTDIRNIRNKKHPLPVLRLEDVNSLIASAEDGSIQLREEITTQLVNSAAIDAPNDYVSAVESMLPEQINNYFADQLREHDALRTFVEISFLQELNQHDQAIVDLIKTSPGSPSTPDTSSEIPNLVVEPGISREQQELLVQRALKRRKIARPMRGQSLSGIYLEIYEALEVAIRDTIETSYEEINSSTGYIKNETLNEILTSCYPKILTHERLTRLATNLQQQIPRSEEWTYASRELLTAIYASEKLASATSLRISESSYDDVVQEILSTWGVQRIHDFDPAMSSIMTWINRQLQWKKSEVMARLSSVHETSVDFRLEDISDTLSENSISKAPLEDFLRECAETCDHGDCQAVFDKHMRNRPEVTFRAVFKERYLLGRTWREISLQFGVQNLAALEHFLKRNVPKILPCLRDCIGDKVVLWNAQHVTVHTFNPIVSFPALPNLQENTQEIYDILFKDFFSIELTKPSRDVCIGEQTELCVHIARGSRTGFENTQTYFLEIPRLDTIGSELNLFLSAPGFQYEMPEVSNLSLDPQENSRWTEQSIKFNLVALSAGTFNVKVELYLNDEFKTQIETIVEVVEIETLHIPSKRTPVYSRPWPQPDLLFQIQTSSDSNQFKNRIHYQLDGYHPRCSFIEEYIYTSDTLHFDWRQTLNNFLDRISIQGHGSSYVNDVPSLVSLGQVLFKSLFPLELQSCLQQVPGNVSVLMLVGHGIEIPWELLHDGKQFLGEKFIIARWPWELDKSCPYEFPVASVSVGYYNNINQLDNWIELLDIPEAPLPVTLADGTLKNLSSAETLRGLHLLRAGRGVETTDSQDAPVLLDINENNQDLERQVRDIKLSLKRNRPLISLGYLNAGQTEWTNLTSTWASTFIRAGCSAFVGPLWTVQPQVEAAFVSTFYSQLWSGKPLGESFRAARQMARVAVPDSMDWLAYVLFGDPMARPYRPVEGQGYAIVEPVGQDIDQPVMPGARVRFRASLRRKPPIWYENRLMDVAETLEFDQLKIYVVTSELQVEPGECIDMTKTPGGDYLGWFTLTVPIELAGRSALVQVHFEDGVEPIHSLRFAVQVADADGGAT